MKQSRLDAWQQFINQQKQRSNMKLSPRLEAMMDNCQYVLHAQFDKNMKSKNKNKKKRQELQEEYREAYKTLDRDEKLAYYIRYMRLICSYLEGKSEPPPKLKGVFSSDVYSRSFNLKMWKHKKMRLDRQKHVLYAQKDNKIKTYVLENYVMRKSKNKDYYCFVLQAINNYPHQKSRTVHLGFKQQSKLAEWVRQLTAVFNVIEWRMVENEMKAKGVKNMTQSSNLQRVSDVASERNKIVSMQEEEDSYMSKSVIVDKMTVAQLRKEQKDKKVESMSLDQSPIFNRNITNEQQFFSDDSSDGEEQFATNPLKSRQTIIQSIAKMDDIEQIEAITQRQKKKVITNQAKEDIFHRIMPEYNLQDLPKTVKYGNLYEDGRIKILGHLEQPSKIKMFITLTAQFSQRVILNALTDAQTMKKTNSEMQQVLVKTMIKSENSSMIYLKIKAYNKLYRPRDFIFLRHVFKQHEKLYIIDKSIENISYPPFTTIVRGELCILWGIFKQSGQNMVVADITMQNQGYLNDSQNVNLVLKYLKPFVNLQKTILQNQSTLNKLTLFNDNWNIIEQYQFMPSVLEKKKSEGLKNIKIPEKIEKQGNAGFKKKKNDIIQQSDIKNGQLKQNNQIGITNKDQKQQQKRENKIKQKVKQGEAQLKQIQLKDKYSHMQEYKGEIDAKQAQDIQKLKNMTVHGIKREFDKNGYVIISKNFIKTKYIINPLPKKEVVFQQAIKGHPIWKGEWIRDQKVGAIIFIDQKKIQDQKGVLKFILSQIGKNLLSGKSVLNISLPVDIFCAQSNLQRLIYSLTYAPTHLQPAVKDKSPLERLKKIVAFGISNSPLYLNMQKPFNPILGQTFQCWIDGCPVYGQQISHHPPIAAILYEGRGFRMTAQLESKVQVHMNSGCGTNDGIFKIKFDDGMQGCYITPGGQVSGLAYGDRKFNMVGKAYYWIQSQKLFLELIFNPTKKGFFSVGKQEQPIDYFEGFVCKVTPEFFENFNKKRKSPSQKQIVQKLGKVHGIWNKHTYYENQIILDIEKQFPAKLQYEANPLPSDANWRQDIAYRRIMETTRAQIQKQRLQVFQRKDRKLRQANPQHSHHKK